jgi:hypothetical protein
MVRSEASEMHNEMKGDLRLVAVVGGATALLSQTAVWGVFAWALSAPFHEVGHTLAAWLVSRLAIPSPFRAIIFSRERELWFFLLQLAGCFFLFRHGREQESGLLVGIASVWASLLVFCSFVLGPGSRDQLIHGSGLGGELLLSAAAIALALAYGSDLPWVYGAESYARQHKVLLFWGAVVFAASATRWLRAVRNQTLIPYGGFGSEEGDLDVLSIDYQWNNTGFVRSYLAAALVSAALVALVAVLRWESRERREPVPFRTTGAPGSSAPRGSRR